MSRVDMYVCVYVSVQCVCAMCAYYVEGVCMVYGTCIMQYYDDCSVFNGLLY